MALVGASPKPGSIGNAMVNAAFADGFDGPIYLVNPGYTEVEGRACYPNLAALPEVPDLAVLALANTWLEAALDDCIALGIGAAVIFASGTLEDDIPANPLSQRIRDKANAAGMAICGPNCMGLIRPSIGLRASAFVPSYRTSAGGVVWLAQSGSAHSALTYNQPRMGFALAVSTGSESVTRLSDYMLWSLDQPETRVIGIFLEGVRDHEAFCEGLGKAQARRVPVVVLKVGRTARSAAMAESHTGALAGNDGVYLALFRKYGVIQVDDLDEMAATLSLFDTDCAIGPGALATMHDSGGERELLVDLSEQMGVPLADISDQTKTRIQPQLDPGLVAENPLDAWGTARDYRARFAECGLALLADPAVAVLGFFSDPRDNHSYHSGMMQAVADMRRAQTKPVFVASNSYMTEDTELAQQAHAAGFPLIKGTRAALKAARNLLHFAALPEPDGFTSESLVLPDLPARRMSEAESLDVLASGGMSTARTQAVTSMEELEQKAAAISFPVVLKTDEGHAHKSDIGGVVLNIETLKALRVAYADMAARLGPRAIVMEMAPEGVEIGLGALIDPGFGPVVGLSAGGVMIEVFGDVAFALAPFGSEVARQMLSELKIAPLLEAHRGRPAADIEELCRAVSQFSAIIWALRDQIAEVDVNPLIVTSDRVVGVDALIIPRNHGARNGS
jgi:acyl-CoA synthetase (NDP forming)